MSLVPVTPWPDEVGADAFVGPQSKGWGRVGSIGTFLIFGGVFATIGILWFAPPPGNIGGAVVFACAYGLAFLWLTTRDHHGESAVQRFGYRHAHKAAVRRGETLYRAARFGSWRLPGVLAQTSASQQRDVRGNPYLMIYTPATGDCAVTFKAHPDGATLRQKSDLDANVNAWEQALRFLCRDPDCVQAQLVTETQADPGYELRGRLLGRVVDGAPDHARQVVEELADDSPQGASSVDSWLTLTFAGRRTRPPSLWAQLWNRLHHRPPIMEHQTTSERQMAARLSTRLPEIADMLSATGAGRCTLAADELIASVRRAYDPECADTIAEATLAGRPWVMRWDSIGPVSAENALTYYRSCGAVHRTYVMTDIHGTVYDESFKVLLEPDKRVVAKRVAITYTLHDPGAASVVAESDVAASQWTINTSHHPTQKSLNTRDSATTTAKHQSKGAGVVDVSVSVTYTILDPDRPKRTGETDDDVAARPRLDTIDAVHESLAPAARLQMRPDDGAQASSFARTLPGPGLRIEQLVKVPVWAGRA